MTTMFFNLLLILLSFMACEKDTDYEVKNDNLPDIKGYPIVGTNQLLWYNNLMEITAPSDLSPFYGQNARYPGNRPKYEDNGDGTITDMVTGLMWSKSPDTNGDGNIDASDKFSYEEALATAATFCLAGHNDWRLPTIKELYSLIVFSGKDPSGYNGTSTTNLVPFIDTDYFDFGYGDITTLYVALAMNAESMFGVNFADGRIKGYPSGPMPGRSTVKKYYVLYVRGNKEYGKNDFRNNGNGTISDLATGLMWMEGDNGEALLWENALDYAERYEYAGYNDWRLPDVKELHSIVDYSRSPSATESAAIDPLFRCTPVTNEAGMPDYAQYWTNTTHANWTASSGRNAAYVCFGRAMGYMGQWIDVHGAGSQRSDPKTGNPGSFPTGHGPQGDVIRIYNFVRLVRNI
jgi:hypothetical protein